MNQNMLADNKDDNTGFPSSTANNDQITHNMSGAAARL